LEQTPKQGNKKARTRVSRVAKRNLIILVFSIPGLVMIHTAFGIKGILMRLGIAPAPFKRVEAVFRC
jgi:hypothetical protein